jgi:N-acetylglucosaminyldiphosphoundecaprenol N-acetyl-beta-D-mannosaminyltransferase
MQIANFDPNRDLCIKNTIKNLDSVVVGGRKVTRVTMQESASLFVEACARSRSGENFDPIVVFTANGNTVSRAVIDLDFRKSLDCADIVHADGQSVVFASKFLTNKPLKERCATTDFFHVMAHHAASVGLNFFLFGGPQGLAERCAKAMVKRYPGLKISGTHHGYLHSEDQVEGLIKAINAASVDILWVGLGVPSEQLFVSRYCTRLKVPVLITCGGCFNFATGDYPRAPRWMQKSSLEWLFRLATAPRKLLLRYAKTNPHALMLFLLRTPRRQAERNPE